MTMSSVAVGNEDISDLEELPSHLRSDEGDGRTQSVTELKYSGHTTSDLFALAADFCLLTCLPLPLPLLCDLDAGMPEPPALFSSFNFLFIAEFRGRSVEGTGVVVVKLEVTTTPNLAQALF
jgi:hypothetical protein